MKQCTTKDCIQQSAKLGLCTRHYQQVKKFGSVQITIYDRRPAVIEGDIAKIPVGYGAKDGYAIVDVELVYLDKHNWYLHKGYAATSIKQERILMQHLILGKRTDKWCDHINRNRLDNRKSNLRHVVPRQNVWNTDKKINNISGYIGVRANPYGRWVAGIGVDSRRLHIGTFATAEQAALAYNEAAIKYRGKYAVINHVG